MNTLGVAVKLSGKNGSGRRACSSGGRIFNPDSETNEGEEAGSIKCLVFYTDKQVSLVSGEPSRGDDVVTQRGVVCNERALGGGSAGKPAWRVARVAWRGVAWRTLPVLR